MVALRGGDNFERVLARLSRQIGQKATLKVGVLEKATYPDGTKVAMVAAIHEFGAPRAHIPARLGWRETIREKSHEWGPVLAQQLRATAFYAPTALARLGEGIRGQLQQSILKANSPALSPVTLMIRKMKSEDQNLVVSKTTVWRAAARVRAGESVAGVPTKPLIDWPIGGQLLNSVDYEVKT